MAEYSDRKDRTITTRWQTTGDLAKFILSHDLNHLDDWGGKEAVREILPEHFQKNFDMIQTDLINCLLEEKNKQTAMAFADNISSWGEWLHAQLDEGKKVVYHYFIHTIEPLLALDFAPICFEILSGLTSALYTDGCEEGIDAIEAEGYPDHLCSSNKGAAGYLLKGYIPQPSCFLKGSAPCDTSNRIYEWAAHKYKVPLIVIEAPYYMNERAHKFLTEEMKRMIVKLEKIAGKKLEQDKLRYYIQLSNEAVDYVAKIQELRKIVPCPDTGWHRPADTIFTAQLGTPFARDYFKALYENVKERVDKGQGVIPEGKKEKRLAWGYTWEAFDLPFFNWLENKHGAIYTEDTLTYFPMDTEMIDTTNMETMLAGLGRRMMQMPMARQVMSFSDVWIKDFVDISRAYKVDALAIGGHMACKHFWALNKLLSDKVKEKTGVPTLRFEMDMMDKRFTSPAELRRIMDDFFATF